MVRVVTYVPGEVFHSTPYVPGSFYNVGKLTGKLHNALADVSVCLFENKTDWFIRFDIYFIWLTD